MKIVQNSVDHNSLVREQLFLALADTSVETVKAQNYHWNVTGPAFGPLHALFQRIYEDHFRGQDDLAERIRSLGGYVDGRYSAFLDSATLMECDGHVTHEGKVKNLLSDQEALSASLLDLARIAEKHGDLVTNDLAVERAGVHEKFAWMLRSHIVTGH